MSSRLPIGVATTWSTPGRPGGSLAAERIDVDRGTELLLQVLAQAREHALLELARALAAHPVAVAELLQGQRGIGQPALAEDRLLAPLERAGERLQLLAQEGGELALLDPHVRTRLLLGRDQVMPGAGAF